MARKECNPWIHIWGPAASPDYEICQLCKVARRKEQHVLPTIEKKQGEQTDESMGKKEDRLEPAATGEGRNLDGQEGDPSYTPRI